jgi:hypothetical protein
LHGGWLLDYVFLDGKPRALSRINLIRVPGEQVTQVGYTGVAIDFGGQDSQQVAAIIPAQGTQTATIAFAI